jgi:GAF domain-containing protein
MREMRQEERLLEAFVTLADTLVAGYDVVELLQTLVETCAATLDVAAVGILLLDEDQRLDLVAATSEESSIVETMQVAAESGPCIQAVRSAQAVSVPDIELSPPEWHRFRDSAREQGFRAVHAIPLRLRQTTIGTLNLFRETTGELDARDARIAQALADVATIGILHERALRESDLVRAQLQIALNTRVVIEQAKGLLAYTHDVSMEEAFRMMRSYARRNNLLLSRVAEDLVNRTLIF